MRLGDREALGAARGGDHLGAERPAALDGGEADAAGRAVHHQGLARLQAGRPAQRAIGRTVGDREAGGGGSSIESGRRTTFARAGHDRLGEAAVTGRRHAPARPA